VGGQRKRSGSKDRHRASGLPNHVVQLATKALDEVRREHWNELRRAGTQDAAKQFKDARWSLLKELYPDVVDGVENEGGVPSRLLKTDAGEGRQEGTPWRMFARSPSGRMLRPGSRWMILRGRVLGG